MTIPQSILDHAIPFLLVLFRLSGLFVFAPAISGSVVPAQARVLLCLMLAVGMYPTVQHAAGNLNAHDFDLLSLGWVVAGETLIGVSIGLIAALPIYAAQLGGLIMGQQMGMGLANIYNPALDVESDTVGQLLLFIAMGVFLAIGGLESLFLSVAGSFNAVPAGFALGVGSEAGAHAANLAGQSVAVVSLDLLVGVLGSGMELAMRVAAPVLCIILLETVAMGFVMKTLPQINVMSIGFATKVLIAIFGLILALTAIEHSIHEEVLAALQGIVGTWMGTDSAG